ncbi:MAG TPA: hypothetical protein VE870_10995, partial [Bacteroidales bacterium]|nr:hypothetical protein [Bacteroidales bacterium]
MEKKIHLGQFIEKGINALEENFSSFWAALDTGVSWTVDNVNNFLLSVPFPVLLIVLAGIAYYAKTGRKFFTMGGLRKGAGLLTFVVLGLLLLYYMGYWNEAIQTTTLVMVATIIALIFGIPLGILAAKNHTADVI